MKGVFIKPTIGIGDHIQFSSLPENYFNATGQKLVDVAKSWIYDHNPFVLRNETPPKETIEIWNFPPKWDWPNPRSDRKPQVYLSNAEIWASVFGVKATLNRPRLYIHEDFPFEKREKILFHVDGKSHGHLPEQVVLHVLKKYKPTGQLYQIGLSSNPTWGNLGIPKIETKTIWDLIKVISECRMLIGADSGPSWIAACFPDVIVKKVRNRPVAETYNDWVPLNQKDYHSHWDDRIFQIFNPTENDIGPFSSYRKM